MRSWPRCRRRVSVPPRRLLRRTLPVVEEGAAADADVFGAGIRPFRLHLLANANSLLLGALEAHALSVLLGASGRVTGNDVAVSLRVRVVLGVDESVVLGNLLLVDVVIDLRALFDHLPRDREPDLVLALVGVGDRLRDREARLADR